MDIIFLEIKLLFGLIKNEVKEMNKIKKGLYLGNINAATNFESLKNKGITHIVGLLSNFKNYKKHEGIAYLLIEIGDSCDQNILEYIPQAMSFIVNGLRSGKVLVHCAAGISRSSSIIIAYLMITKSLNFIDAENFVRKQRNCILPNEGFKRQISSIDVDDYKKYLV